MDDDSHCASLASKFTGHRINEEWHVVGDNAQHSCTRLVSDIDQRRSLTSVKRKGTHGLDLLDQSIWARWRQVLGRDVMEEPLGERSILRIIKLRNLLAEFLQADEGHGVTLLQMPRDVVREFSWVAAPENVYDIFTDESFQRQLAASTGSLEVQVRVNQSPSGRIVQTSRVLPAQVPSFARPLVGETVRVEEEQRWQALENQRTTADLRITFSGPLVGRGTFELRPGSEPGTTQGRFALTFKANVPFVGGKVEALIAEQIEQYLQVQAALVTEWLKDPQS